LCQSSTSLSECIDGTLSTEHIEGFKCAKCTLQHAIHTFRRRLESAAPDQKERLEDTISRLEQANESDPENIPDDIALPEKGAPKSRIAKRMRIEDYPDIIALHLSRSIYDSYGTRRNGAKVSFEETLQMGGILDRKKYRLLCMVTHKGGHESGHYECFRRQIVARPPFALPTPVPSSPVTPLPSTPLNTSSVRLSESSQVTDASLPFSENSRLSVNAPTRSSAWLSNSDATPKDTPRSSIALQHASAEFSRSNTPTPSELERQAKTARKLKKKRPNDRWWRISDDKIKEARTSDVLGMQKEVYLLFYQRERDDDPI
jgi:ubiquitin carboxyl-terminal hydrolase 16